MLRKLPLVLVVGCIFALVASGGAFAYSGGSGSPVTQSQYKEALRSLITDPSTVLANPGTTNAATGSAITTAEIQSGLNTGRAWQAVLTPRLTLLASTLALSAAGYTGWKVGSILGGVIYKRLTGTTYGGSTSALTLSNLKWQCYTGGATTGQWAPCGSSGSFTGFFGSGTAPGAWYFQDTSYVGSYHCVTPVTLATCGGTTAAQQDSAIVASLCATTGVTCNYEWESGTSNGSCATVGHANCALVYIDQVSYERLNKVTDDTDSGYNGAGLKVANIASTGSSTCDDACLNAILTHLGAFNTSTSCPDCEAVLDALNKTLNPTYQHGDGGAQTTTFTPFVIPQPKSTETYDQYLDRLRAQGWVGTATVTDATTTSWTSGSDADLAVIGTPTEITIGTTTITVYNSTGTRVAWPSNPPQVASSTSPISLKKSPTGGSYGTPQTPENCGSSTNPCNLAPPTGTAGGIDFSPITSLDPGCSFPYGFVCYAQEVNGWFDTTPTAPRFDLPVHGQTAGGSVVTLDNHYDVNLNVMDDYMTIWRTILSVVIWVGAVYVLATRLLGFKAGGDPGEAIDEVL